MQPTQTQNPISSSPQGIDSSVVALMHGIKMQEGGGTINYNAIGDRGTAAGAGQWSNQPAGKPIPLAKGQIPSNFINAARQYGLDPTDFSPANQNKVLYAEISAAKKAGLTPEQILSQHNSGDPNAYSNPQRAIGTGDVGSFNVSTYVKQAMGYAQKYAQANTSTQPSLPDISSSAPVDNRDFLTKAGDALGSIFGGAQIGKAVGTGLGYLYTKAQDSINGTNNAQYYDTSIPTPLQLAGDVGQVGLTLAGAAAPFLGEAAQGAEALAPVVRSAVGAEKVAQGAGVLGTVAKVLAPTTALGRIASNAGLGAGLGVTSALANGATSPSEIAGQGAFGAGVGGVAGAAGEALSHLIDTLPRRITNNLLPQLKNNSTLDYAIENTKLGSVDSMVKSSSQALDNYDNSITSLLKNHPEYSLMKVGGEDILNKTLGAFPNSEYTADSIISKVKSQIPADAGLVTKLQKEGLNLDEANTLRKAIDRVTYKLTIDSPEVKAGKDVAEAFGNALRSEVQTRAPETAPIFKNFSKEINLNKALKKLQAREGKKGFLGFKELLGALGVGGLFGPVAEIGTLVGGKVAETPGVRIGAAKVLKASQPLVKGGAQIIKTAGAVAGKIPVTR